MSPRAPKASFQSWSFRGGRRTRRPCLWPCCLAAIVCWPSEGSENKTHNADKSDHQLVVNSVLLPRIHYIS
jgi:hypothetical protein